MQLNCRTSTTVVISLFTTFGFSLTIPQLSSAIVQQKTCAEMIGASDAATFKDSQCEEVKLTQATSFYRYHSDDTNKFGRFMTTNKYGNNVDVIKNLALKQIWGNKATKIITVTLPTGTITYQGIVAFQDPAACYPGGGQQTYIVNSKDPNIQWSASQPLTVNNFVCP
jgi:hypothetical protein